MGVIKKLIPILLIAGLLLAIQLVNQQRDKDLEDQRQELKEKQEVMRQLAAERNGLLSTINSLTKHNADLKQEVSEMAEVLQWETQIMEVTHYAPLDPQAIEGMCYSGDPSVTASGSPLQVGITAAAAWDLPYGTKLYIPGYGFRIVEDRGGSITSGKLDIAVASREEAFRLGRQQLNVYIRKGAEESALH